MNRTILRPWLWLALANLLLATVLGALMRYAFVEELSWMKYRFVLHAHSHVAMLGWVGQALFVLLAHTFVSDLAARARPYHWALGISQISIWGMLLTFPFYGYSGPSIAFSTLNILTSYALVYRLAKDADFSGWSGHLLRTALIFLVVSTLPLWGMAPIIILGLQGSALYYAAIQFFLHCQFNGWFIFSLLAMLFFWLKQERGFEPRDKQMRYFFGSFLVASVLTYALAVAWSTPLPIIFWTNNLGVLLQLIALAIFWRILRSGQPQFLAGVPRWTRALLLLALASFIGKVLVQGAVVIPFVAEAAYTIRNYVIGFIHLMQLGIFTAFILAFAQLSGLLHWRSPLTRIGLTLLFAGFILSELLLFLQGTMFWGAKGFLPNYYEWLFAVSALMPVGVLLVLWSAGTRSTGQPVTD